MGVPLNENAKKGSLLKDALPVLPKVGLADHSVRSDQILTRMTRIITDLHGAPQKIHFANMVFSTKIKGNHHLQGNVQVYNDRPFFLELGVSESELGPMRMSQAIASFSVCESIGQEYVLGALPKHLCSIRSTWVFN